MDRIVPDEGTISRFRSIRAESLFLLILCLLSCSFPASVYANAQPEAPPPNSPQQTGVPRDTGSIHFAVIGDYGIGNRNEADVAALIHSWHADFIITTGDNRYGNHTYDQVVGRFFCAYLKDAGPGKKCQGGYARINAFFPTLGNHDYKDGRGIGEYLAYFTLPGKDFPYSTGNERYYDYVRGPVHFFVINSNDQEPDGVRPDSIQAAWLKSRLTSSTTPWQIVYFHHPPYSSGSHGSSKWMQWPFESWGVDAVISGHDHSYERLHIGGIPYFVNGLGGKSTYEFRTSLPQSRVRYNRDYGAMLVEADNTQIHFRFINRQGELIDSFRLARIRAQDAGSQKRQKQP